MDQHGLADQKKGPYVRWPISLGLHACTQTNPQIHELYYGYTKLLSLIFRC